MGIDNFSYEQQDQDLYGVEDSGQSDVLQSPEWISEKQGLQNELLTLSEGILPSRELIDGHAGEFDLEGNFMGNGEEFEK